MPGRRDGVTIPVGTDRTLEGLLDAPADPLVFLVLAHGAGAGMGHRFMEGLAEALVERRVAVLRYPFPYMQDGRRRPDPPATLVRAVRAAGQAARSLAGTRPLFAGGKSMGGRMTTLAASEAPLDGVLGLVLFGFPLHAARRPSTSRGDHLARVAVPLLFVQGTRDALGEPDLLRTVVERSGARGTLHVVEGADHGLHVPARSGRTDADVMEEIADAAVEWMLRAT